MYHARSGTLHVIPTVGVISTENKTFEGCLFLNVVVTCRALPDWDGMTVNTTRRRYQTAVNASCDDHFMFPNREPFIESVCSARGSWVPEIPDCVCEFTDLLSSLKTRVTEKEKERETDRQTEKHTHTHTHTHRVI